MISAERAPCVMLSGPENELDEVEAVFGDVGVGDDNRDSGLVACALGITASPCRPDDDRVDFLLDQVLDLRDLAGHVAAGVKNDRLDVVGLDSRGDEGLAHRSSGSCRRRHCSGDADRVFAGRMHQTLSGRQAKAEVSFGFLPKFLPAARESRSCKSQPKLS
jgi:hypothetical protein